MQFSSTVFSIGHSNWPSDHLLSLLAAHEISFLADVRSIARSRFSPQFNQNNLEVALAAQGIAYLHWPQLGGRRKAVADSPNTALAEGGMRAYADYMATRDFVDGVGALLSAARGHRMAMLCAERDPAQCHRAMLADYLQLQGIAVQHILGNGDLLAHPTHPEAQMVAGTIRYPAQQGRLF